MAAGIGEIKPDYPEYKILVPIVTQEMAEVALCLELRRPMSAREIIKKAEAEDIKINNSWGPRRIITEGGRVKAVEFRKCLSVFDKDGRFSPCYDDDQTIIVETGHVLISVGQSVDWGDLLTGPKFAIDAIASGKEGAISIHRWVQNGQSLVLGRTKSDYRALDKESLDLDGYDRLARQRTWHVCGQDSMAAFRDLRGILTEEQVKKETERCLGCGVTVVDEFMCVGCGSCTTRCKFDAISLVRKYDAEGVDLPELKPRIVKHILKRKARIAVKKQIRAIKSVFSADK